MGSQRLTGVLQGQPHPEAVAAGRDAVDAWSPTAGHPHLVALRRTFIAPVRPYSP